MKRLPFYVAILLGLAVSASAQIAIEGRIGRAVRGAVAIDVVHDHPRRAHRQPVRCHHEPRGRWETVCEQVLVPGYWHTEHVPPIHGWIYDACGHRHWGIVRDGICHRVWVPARWETRSRRVWVSC